MNEILHDISTTVRVIEPTAEIILFGSQARGDASEFSDWDILILADRPFTVKQKHTMMDALYALEVRSGKILAPLFHSKDEWSNQLRGAAPMLYPHIVREGIRL
jgi:uncharacterized protein